MQMNGNLHSIIKKYEKKNMGDNLCMCSSFDRLYLWIEINFAEKHTEWD